MKICLSKEGCQKNNISIGELLLLLIINNSIDLAASEELLIQKGFITSANTDLFPQSKWRITNNGKEIVNAVILDSEQSLKPEESLTELAKKLKEIFPKGKKAGTNYYWSDGIALIVRRLKLFFKKYDNIYTNEQIIQAAEKYVSSFNGNYTYMKLLKYFILKEKVDAAGDVDGESELISYIENAGQEEALREDWTSTLK